MNIQTLDGHLLVGSYVEHVSTRTVASVIVCRQKSAGAPCALMRVATSRQHGRRNLAIVLTAQRLRLHINAGTKEKNA